MEREARKLWELGKEFGAAYAGSEEKLVEKLIELEKRDKGWSKFIYGNRDGDADGIP